MNSSYEIHSGSVSRALGKIAADRAFFVSPMRPERECESARLLRSSSAREEASTRSEIIADERKQAGEINLPISAACC